ncbi:MarR family winged helix-turn-helix transcriptional regulator [Streptomyces sp. JL1001]|uniref:MarR family winged helix-turn-helix transcriptional regulator n=1 Tax=Streptomyces sp. JL1001 TaxID=3078227 RepID=A0AAU8KU25_9ACTN
MTRSASGPSTPGTTPPDVSGQMLLAGFAGLRKGLLQWMRANIPTGGGMTVPRATLLMGLMLKTEPAGMGELGEPLGMSPRNMTVLVDGLEKEGLVRRVVHPSDRRIKLVELTEAGRTVVVQHLEPSQDTAAGLFDDFTAEERGELLRLLLKTADALRERGIDMPPPPGQN